MHHSTILMQKQMLLLHIHMCFEVVKHWHTYALWMLKEKEKRLHIYSNYAYLKFKKGDKYI